MITVLFDLDGTLTDPKKGILACFNFALEHLGYERITDEQIGKYIGPPLREGFWEALNTDDESLVNKAVNLYRSRFSEKGIYENELYPHTNRILSELNKSGISIMVATSKPKSFANKIVYHFGMDEYISAVYGSELDGKLSSKSELIRHIVAEKKLKLSNVIMVGDRKHDILGAVENNIYAIGVLWGYGTKTELENSFADCICQNDSELLECINNYVSQVG